MSRDMREVMREWANWRKGRISAGLYWPSKSTLGKAMDGMPGTVCPSCRGRDVDCPICYGTGRIKLDPGGIKVNPAFIPSTRREPDSEINQIVDRLMCDFRSSEKTKKYFFVLWAEFVKPNGTQEMKAEQIRKSQRINLSHENYRYILHYGLRLVEAGIDESVRNSNTEALTQS